MDAGDRSGGRSRARLPEALGHHETDATSLIDPMTPHGWAPDEAFDAILSYAVIPTFDLILDSPKGVLLVRRKIPPYKGRWSLPGLRILKGESIGNCLIRIAKFEVGIDISRLTKRFVDQSTVRFRSENARQDLSSCYAILIEDVEVVPNPSHYSSCRWIRRRDASLRSLPSLYSSHLGSYWKLD